MGISGNGGINGNSVRHEEGGTDISDADALVSEVKSGKTFYATAEPIKTGTLALNNPSVYDEDDAFSAQVGTTTAFSAGDEIIEASPPGGTWTSGRVNIAIFMVRHNGGANRFKITRGSDSTDIATYHYRKNENSRDFELLVYVGTLPVGNSQLNLEATGSGSHYGAGCWIVELDPNY
jgi:hypothetical protein